MMLSSASRKADTITETPTAGGHRSGAARDFGGFVEEHFPSAYRFAFCMSLAHGGAADLTEAVFCEARIAGDRVPDRRTMLASLYRRWPEMRLEDTMAAGASPSRLVAASVTSERAAEFDESTILTVVHGMPAELRLVLSLFYFEQLGYADIAHILELPNEIVISRLAEAKTLLRCRLKTECGENGRLPSPLVVETEGGSGA